MTSTLLITGGAGYIGSHTCVELLIKGYKVIIFDSFFNSYEENIKNIINIVSKVDKNLANNLSFFKGDIRNLNSLENVFRTQLNNNNPISAVIHFAGLKSVEESNIKVLEYWDVNVGGTIKLIKVMDKYRCKKLLFSSTASIYSNEKNQLLNENSKIKPSSPYGQTKSVVENLLENYYSSNKNISIALLRYFNPIGAHHSGLLGDEPLGKSTNILPLINKVALGELDYLRIYGDDWPTIDGTGIRDYLHVVDLALGHIKTLEYLEKNDPMLIKFNIGTGKGTSVKELIETFERVNNLKIPYKIEKRRKGDVAISIADNSLIKEKLKWSPNKDLETMCLDSWKFKKLNS